MRYLACLTCLLATAGLSGQIAGAADGPRFKVAYATYLGGSAWDQGREVIPFADGSVLIGAQSSSTDMPISAGAVQPKYAGDDPNLGHGGVYGGDCYLARINSDGSKVLAATYFGGSKQERNVYGMELDRAGNVVITSMTRSRDIPTTEGCFQARSGGGAGTIFVAKLSSDLQRLMWCTYLGGSGDEAPRGGLALDAQGNVCIFGTTASDDFPTTPGAYQTKRNGRRDAFVAKLKADGSGLVWSTLFGGSDLDYMLGGRIAEDGDVYFAGHTTSSDLPGVAGSAQARPGGQHDAYMVRLSENGANLRYATYVGGRENEFPEHRPYLNDDGSVLLPGVTGSPDFPTTARGFQTQLRGKNDAFLTKIAPDGSSFEFSTLFGGGATEFCLMPTPGPDGNWYIVGQTESRDLPTTEDALMPQFGGGQSDGWLAILSPDASRLLYGTYLGGSGNDMVRSIAFGHKGELFLVGNTSSEDFPTTSGVVQERLGGGSGDVFLMKLTQ